MYDARAIKVMIASPSDVAQERQIVRSVVHEWNAIHSEDMRIVLMPVGWETHSQPQLGDRPQEIINKTVLRGCDLLIAVFWTRIGSPTDVSASGTVGDRRTPQRQKPALVYFSQAPVRRDSIDDAQYGELLKFKKLCMERGLIESYNSMADFQSKLARQLAQTVIQRNGRTVDRDLLGVGVELSGGYANSSELDSLTDDCKAIAEAASDRSGSIMRLRMMGGMRILTNGREFTEMGNPRSEARWDEALSTLEELDLIAAVGYKREIFRLTNRGYEIADLLRTDRSSEAGAPGS